MQNIAQLNVSGAIVGQTFKVGWASAQQVPSLPQQASGIVDHLAVYNESGIGFLLKMDQSNRTFSLPAGGWITSLPVTVQGSVDTDFTLTALYILPNAGVNTILVDYFYPGEPVTATSLVLGNSPVNVAGGAVTANAILNSGNPPGTAIITASASGSPTGSVSVANDGTTSIRLIDHSSFAFAIQLSPGSPTLSPTQVYGNGSTVLNKTSYYGDLATFGSSVTLPLGAQLVMANASTNWTMFTDLSSNLVITGAPGSLSITPAGVIRAFAPITLLTGNQETGHAGGAGKGVAGGDIWAWGVNFKTHMTNIPSSVTLSATSSLNCTASATNITRDGFDLALTVTAGGAFNWTGSYTTVGN